MSQGSNEEALTIDFSGLIFGFSSAALYYLGETDLLNKEKKGEKNLSLAKQNIDILLLLKEKTKNNITAEESKLLEQVLTDLRLKYIEAGQTK